MRGLHAMRAVALAACIGFSGWSAAGDGVAFTAPKTALTELEATVMPSGLASLCRRDPAFCQPVHEDAHKLVLSPARWKLLRDVNRSVNHRIKSTTDQKLYGVAEYWTIPASAGDCEDFVLLKRQILMGLGVPETSLLMTVVQDENGEGHAVLTIPTTAGDIILDNRRDEILGWWATGYKFIKRQSAADPLRWVSLGREKLQATSIASGPQTP